MRPALTIDLSNGLLNPVNFQYSPHCDERPLNSIINLIVIHNISLPPGQFGTTDIEAFFCGKLNKEKHPFFSTIADLNVSAHLLINRSGGIVQFVPFTKRAWHAGQSEYEGVSGCNDFSIGIELEGTDDIPYELRQYEQLREVINLLTMTYPSITKNRIVGHNEISPKRKSDPGPSFDWAYLKRLLV